MPEMYQGKEYKTIIPYLEDGIGYVQLNRPKGL